MRLKRMSFRKSIVLLLTICLISVAFPMVGHADGDEKVPAPTNVQVKVESMQQGSITTDYGTLTGKIVTLKVSMNKPAGVTSFFVCPIKKSKPGSNYEYDKVATGNMPFVHTDGTQAYWEGFNGNVTVGPNGEKIVNDANSLTVEVKVVKHDNEPQSPSMGYYGDEKGIIEVQSNNGKQYEEYRDSEFVRVEFPIEESSVGKTFDVKGEVNNSGNNNSGNNNSGNNNSGSNNSGSNSSGNNTSNSSSENNTGNNSSENNSGNTGSNETTSESSDTNNSSEGTSGTQDVTQGEGSGEQSSAEKVKLSKVKISSVKAGKKSITVKWNKLSKKRLKKTKKIQVQYSKDKTFKTGVKTKTVDANKTHTKITKLEKGQRYYVRIRAYTKSGKTINVSQWSASKSKKTK